MSDQNDEAIDPELERLITWFIKKRKGRLAWEYGVEKLYIAPWDTFNLNKSNEEKYIVYGTNKKRNERQEEFTEVILIKGQIYNGYYAPL